MKGESPITRLQQAEIEFGDWLRVHLVDAGEALKVVMHRHVKGSELLLNNFDQPLVVLAEFCRRILGSEFLYPLIDSPISARQLRLAVIGVRRASTTVQENSCEQEQEQYRRKDALLVAVERCDESRAPSNKRASFRHRPTIGRQSRCRPETSAKSCGWLRR